MTRKQKLQSIDETKSSQQMEGANRLGTQVDLEKPSRRGKSTRPAWSEWSVRSSGILWELVAISKDINPLKLKIINEEYPRLYHSYQARLRTAIRCVGSELTIFDHPNNGVMAEDKIFLKSEFIQWLTSINKKFPHQLLGASTVNVEPVVLKVKSNSDGIFDSLPTSGIANIFKLDVDPENNKKKWNDYARQAKRNGLFECRDKIGVGRGKSTFDPMKVGVWLVSNGIIEQDRVNKCLGNNLPPRNAYLKENFVQK